MLRTLGDFSGPVFIKEALQISRRRRYYFNRVLYCGALLVALFVAWEESSWTRSQVAAGQIQQLAAIGQDLFLVFSIVQYAALFLFVPIFICGTVSSERETKTLDLLLTTHLTDREIIFGKLASRLAVMVPLVLSALPVMSLVMWFGGVDPGALWRVQGATLLALLFTGAHAIYFSTTSRTPVSALIRTYWWLTVWLAGVALFVAILSDAIRFPPRGTPGFLVMALVFVNPVMQFITCMIPEAYNDMSNHVGSYYFAASFLLPAAWSLWLIRQSVVQLRAIPGRHTPWLARLPGYKRWRAIWTWLGKTPNASIGRLVPIQMSNPLWQRARLAPVYDRDRHICRIQRASWFVAAAFLLLVGTLTNDLDDEEAAMAFLGTTWIALCALVAIIAGTSLVGDRKRGILDLVLTTPMSPQQYIDGTMLAVWQHVRSLFYLAIALAFFFCMAGDPDVLGSICSLITAILFLGVVALLGIACGLAAKNVPQAVICSFGFPVVVCLGPVCLIEPFRSASGPILWILTGILLVGSRLWVRKRFSTAAMACEFLAIHLALCSLATFWTIRRDEFPIIAMHPGFWTLGMLDNRFGNWYRGNGEWFFALPCYWAALALSFYWARRWIIRNFDFLVGRATAPDMGLRPISDGLWPGWVFRPLVYVVQRLPRPWHVFVFARRPDPSPSDSTRPGD